MNTFKKLCSGVYGLQSPETYKHGDKATITTKYGKEVDVRIWKLLKSEAGINYYSVVRDDGKTAQERLRAKAEKRERWAQGAEAKSDAYYERSRKDADFLSLGEPIKVGHHSEQRHRKAIADADANLGRSVEESKKADAHQAKAETLATRSELDIFIDHPDCLERLKSHITELEGRHTRLKASPSRQSYQLSNSNANLNRYRKRLELASWLWEVEGKTNDIQVEPAPATKEKDFDLGF